MAKCWCGAYECMQFCPVWLAVCGGDFDRLYCTVIVIRCHSVVGGTTSVVIVAVVNYPVAVGQECCVSFC